MILFDINLSPLTEGSDWEDNTSGGDRGDSVGEVESGGRVIELENENWKLRQKIEEMEINTKRD